MNSKEFKKSTQQLKKLADGIMNAKQPEYTNNNTDILYNFKSTAESIGIEPMEVWAVFFHKHVQAILSHAHNPEMHEAEPIESRYADATNYLNLGYALMKERDCKVEIIGRAGNSVGESYDPQFGNYEVQPGDAGTEGAYLRRIKDLNNKNYKDEAKSSKSKGRISE